MRSLLAFGVLAAAASAVSAQAIHHGYIWIEGPDGVLQANTTYTLEVWGRIASPAWVDGDSALAGFGIDVINTAGADSVARVSNVQIARWAEGYGTLGTIVGLDIVGTSGGQPFWHYWVDPPDPNTPDRRNPLLLFQFDCTTSEVMTSPVAFTVANPNPNGGLSFYPFVRDGASIIVPNDAETELHLTGWTSVPTPGGATASALLISMCAGGRRRG